ncbi:hypothetical protein V500_03444, partial [Pseudogymnoascus sp. VKM F-4518 (FW-2643)]
MQAKPADGHPQRAGVKDERQRGTDNIEGAAVVGESVSGLNLGAVGDHFKNIHKVEERTARNIVLGISAVQWGKGWDKFNRAMPADGSRPQEGLPVVDGVRCQICHDFKARTVEEVERHLYELHSKTEGGLWEHARMQSWGGQGGVDDEYWVVYEGNASEERRVGNDSKGCGGKEENGEDEEWGQMDEEWGQMDEEWEICQAVQDERRELGERSDDSGADKKVFGKRIPEVDLYEEVVRDRVRVGRGGEAFDQDARGREDVGKGGSEWIRAAEGFG